MPRIQHDKANCSNYSRDRAYFTQLYRPVAGKMRIHLRLGQVYPTYA